MASNTSSTSAPRRSTRSSTRSNTRSSTTAVERKEDYDSSGFSVKNSTFRYNADLVVIVLRDNQYWVPFERVSQLTFVHSAAARIMNKMGRDADRPLKIKFEDLMPWQVEFVLDWALTHDGSNADGWMNPINPDKLRKFMRTVRKLGAFDLLEQIKDVLGETDEPES